MTNYVFLRTTEEGFDTIMETLRASRSEKARRAMNEIETLPQPNRIDVTEVLAAIITDDSSGGALSDLPQQEVADFLDNYASLDGLEDLYLPIPEDDGPDMSCDQCVAAMINGVYCHELGCPNTDKDKVDGEWIARTDMDDEWEVEDEA